MIMQEYSSRRKMVAGRSRGRSAFYPRCWMWHTVFLRVRIRVRSGTRRGAFEHKPCLKVKTHTTIGTFIIFVCVRGCIQKFPDWVDNEVNSNKYSLRSNTRCYGDKTHYTDSQDSDTTATSCRELYHLQFPFQAASPETFGYIIVCLDYGLDLLFGCHSVRTSFAINVE